MSDSVTPPVDLNKPVTNPNLVAAIRNHQTARSNESAAALFGELKNAVLLVAAIVEKPLSEPRRPGVTFEKGEKIGFIEVRDNENKRLLALFTDHPSMQPFASQANASFVMPTKQALSFVLERSFYVGLVINPSGDATLRLDSPFIRQVIGSM